MAKRRMFSIEILNTDAFTSMPPESQILYIFLCMGADDDGFVSNPGMIMRSIKIYDEQFLEILISKKYILCWDDDDVIAIRHWRIHNSIRSDRYTKTIYADHLKSLAIENDKSYTKREDMLQIANGNQLDTNWQPTGNQLDTNWQPTGYPDKDSIDKYSIDIEDTTKKEQAGEKNSYNFGSDALNDAFADWIAYKKERREVYREVGLKNLISQIKKASERFGADAVAELISRCIACRYAGIVFDRLEHQVKPAKEHSFKISEIDKMMEE